MRWMGILTDTVKNSNKFYEIELDGDMVHAWNGRVGETRVQQPSKPGGEREFKKRQAEKIKKGYSESKIDLEVITETSSSTGNVMDIAMSQIKTDDCSKLLIAKLVQQNIHNITSNTKITYDIKTGYFKTDLGIVKKEGVDEALVILNDILGFVNEGNVVKKENEFRKLNENYFRIIPTRLKSLRELSSLLNTEKKVLEQIEICNSLSDSLDIIEVEKNRIRSEDKPEHKQEQIFDTSVFELTDKKEFKRLVDYFNKSKNSRHGHNDYKVEKIYTISLGKEEVEYKKDLPNQMELFHGTKIANLLSILKSGLLMPKYSPGSVTGYMFGQGLYFASQSTKSLNYCDGMYWNNSKKQDKIYMFIADIAMGNYQVPSSSRSKMPDKGYDSYWAQPGKSGIQNDEMIIFNNNQIRLKYILEITK
jgi:poly [ADP-ribose] polymerase